MATMTLPELSRRLQAQGSGGLVQVIQRKLAGFSLKLEARAKRNATRSPRARSGRLRASIRSMVFTQPTLEVHLVAGGRGNLGSGQVNYAPAQEFGARVTARSGGKLRIPLPPARTPAGVDRNAGVSLRRAGGFFVIRSRAGNLLLVRRRGQGIEPWYLLVDSVDVPATRFLGRALDDGVTKDLPAPLRDAFRVALVEERG